MRAKIVATEREIQKQCRDYLVMLGAFVIRCNSGGVTASHNGKSRFVRFNDQPGCSDLLAVLPGIGDAPSGRFAAIEVKRQGGKPTELQKAFLGEVSRRGGLAIVVDSLEALQAALEAEGY